MSKYLLQISELEHDTSTERHFFSEKCYRHVHECDTAEEDPNSDFHDEQLIADISSEIASAAYLFPHPTGLAYPTNAIQSNTQIMQYEPEPEVESDLSAGDNQLADNMVVPYTGGNVSDFNRDPTEPALGGVKTGLPPRERKLTNLLFHKRVAHIEGTLTQYDNV